MPLAEIDPRIVRVGIEIEGALKVFDGLQIVASGTKYANPLQNECEVKVSNLSKSDRDYILTETSPFNRNRVRKRMRVWAGRQSKGVRLLFSGDITEATIGQPPDIVLTMKAKTGQFNKGLLMTQAYPETVGLSTISKGVATSMGLALDFQADEKNVSNYSYTGSQAKQVDHLAALARIDAYVDDDRLVVKNATQPLSNATSVLSADSGMIGIPELTETGVRVKYMLDCATELGARLDLRSELNPAVNGSYTIFKLSFEVASRDTPFYYIAEARRPRPVRYDY